MDRLFDKFSYDQVAYEATVDLYSKEMQKSIMNVEQIIHFDNAIGYKWRNGVKEKYDLISKYYGSLLQEESENKYFKLMNVFNYLDSDFESEYTRDNIVGVDRIDVDILYSTWMYKYGMTYRGCGVIPNYQIKSDYNEEHGFYVTKLVTPLSPRRFKIIYRGHSYSWHDNELKLQLSQSDIDRGYANLIIKDRSTFVERPYKLEIPS